MDYFKATEAYLYNYKSLKVYIENIDFELKEEPTGLSGISYEEEKTGKTFRITSTVENEVVAREKAMQYLNREKNIALYAIKKIDKGIESLSSLEKRILNLKYFSDEKLSWRQIGEIVRYNPDHCRKKVRTDAINKLAVSLFGIAATKIPTFDPLLTQKNAV